MLDNMTTEQLKESIDYIAGREIEVSGNVTKENIARLTGLGVIMYQAEHLQSPLLLWIYQ